MKGDIWNSFHSSRWTRGSWCHRAPGPICHMLVVGTSLPHSPRLPSGAAPKPASVLSLGLHKVGKYLSGWQALLWRCPSRCTQKCHVFSQILNRKDISDLIARSFWLTAALMASLSVADTGMYSFVSRLPSNHALPLWLCFPPTRFWSFSNCLFRAQGQWSRAEAGACWKPELSSA